MVFKKYNSRNDAVCLLQTAINETSTTIIAKGAFNRFSTSNFIIKVTYKDVSGAVVGRENMLISTRVGSTFNISQRAYEEVPTTDESTSNVLQAVAFPADAVIEEVFSSEVLKDIQEEITQVREDFVAEDITLLKNPTLSSKSANYTLLATEKNNTVFSMDTSGGNRTFTLNPALFPTTNGCFVFTFTKSTTDANTVTIDVGSGNTIDGSQTYILTAHNESVTIVIQSSTFVKILCTEKKPISVSVNNLKQTLIAGETLTALQVYRGFSFISQTLSTTVGSSVLLGTGTTYYASITPATNIRLKSVTLRGSTNLGSQTHTVTIRDSTNATIHETGSGVFPNNTLASRVCNFPGVFELQAGVQYNIFVSMSGANSYNAYNGTESSPFLTGSSISSTTTFLENIEYFQVEDRDKKFLALANSTEKINVEGICITGATLGNTFTGAFNGIIGGLSFSSVDIGKNIYLTNTGGVSLTPGTNPVLLGTVYSTTEMILSSSLNRKTSTSFIASRDLSLATSTVTYTHNLGRFPKLIGVSSRNSASVNSQGVFSENGQQSIYIDGSGSFADNVNAIRMHTGVGAFVTGFIQNITETSFDVVYTRTSTPTGTAQILFLLQ